MHYDLTYAVEAGSKPQSGKEAMDAADVSAACSLVGGSVRPPCLLVCASAEENNLRSGIKGDLRPASQQDMQPCRTVLRR
jgi:hypothetical protein